MPIDRRVFLQDAAAAAAAIALPARRRRAEPDLAPVFAQIAQYELHRLGVPPSPPAPPASPGAPAQPGAPGGASRPTTGPPTTLAGSSTTRNSP